ncbi:Pimeloyl-ACP methyl ester carboxylesterase [Streptoalloteichus tenebrarius]|uniref:Pimeloyl-ACP methyl ester carboxylesterase n=1 Tax=Streptoalloteichus tenebrarius (strain ATCC 17920 / DSM 40477 / JCM 4838 / CBS 697.72 / NBRC 16177 / NCIMB 11028 / NRRL B-12390 / A12253. 1 / ISP 5477) TaxID=1933 RepID=A0ABT1HRM4_STRSD|nr:alpha/beta fold hydrolase [Streptoalloteichus tenebrarius]MCP2258167.1 Pimeloyl-ACP methyl ester carboxylesterase [Streptoalloteichus tenebrarius]BFF04606.1 alpha/beta hydrolase [Streptoalloteichus tenebrarius]
MSERSGAEGVDQYAALPSGMTICFRDWGDRADPAILLIAGLGEDLTFWTDSFVGALVARSFRVIAMDNRDVGQSTFVATPAPRLWRQVLARPRGDAYSLADMANDGVGVLDHLGIEQVHLVGRSMGGMIAQTIAATEPRRVLSLTSIFSTTGARNVGQPALSTIRLLAARPARTRTAAVCAHLRITRHIAGRAYPIDDAAEAAIAARGWDRGAGDLAAGVARQIQAIQASGDRTAQLRGITAPTLVINGDRDLMVAPSGGAATVKAIRSARHVVIPGMGHHIPEALIDPITQHISRHANRVGKGGNHGEIS